MNKYQLSFYNNNYYINNYTNNYINNNINNKNNKSSSDLWERLTKVTSGTAHTACQAAGRPEFCFRKKSPKLLDMLSFSSFLSVENIRISPVRSVPSGQFSSSTASEEASF